MGLCNYLSMSTLTSQVFIEVQQFCSSFALSTESAKLLSKYRVGIVFQWRLPLINLYRLTANTKSGIKKFESIALCPGEFSLFIEGQVPPTISNNQRREARWVVFITVPSLHRFCSISNYRRDRDE